MHCYSENSYSHHTSKLNKSKFEKEKFKSIIFEVGVNEKYTSRLKIVFERMSTKHVALTHFTGPPWPFLKYASY